MMGGIGGQVNNFKYQITNFKMKIFSLETKKHLVGWSVIFSIMLFLYSSFLFTKTVPCNDNFFSFIAGNCKSFGWPYSFTFFDPPTKLLVDFIFWIIVSLIILSIIRHFKGRRDNAR